MITQIQQKLNNRTVDILGHEQMRKYAVLIPLIEDEELGTSILFQVRAKSLRRQPGEISFPGGKMEELDQHPRETAVRETSEELGIPSDQIHLIHQLDTYIPSQQSIIYPFVAQLDVNHKLLPNPDEVEKTFCVPVDFFLKNEPETFYLGLKIDPDPNFPFERIPGGRDYPFRTGKIPELFYTYKDKVIWGMTARILKHFISIIG